MVESSSLPMSTKTTNGSLGEQSAPASASAAVAANALSSSTHTDERSCDLSQQKSSSTMQQSMLYSNLSRAGSAVDSALNGFVQLQSKGVGLDMTLKSACWTLRLVSALSEKKKGGEWFGVGAFENEERQKWASTLIMAIIDERMMFNQWKWISTARNAYETGFEVKNAYTDDSRLGSVSDADRNGIHSSSSVMPSSCVSPQKQTEISEKRYGDYNVGSTALALTQRVDVGRLIKLFTFFTYFCRTFEQGQGDVGFWNRFWFTNWDNKKHSRRYKLFKSITLTFSLVVESLKIVELLAKLKKAELEAKPPRPVPATPIEGSASFDYALGITDLRQKLQKSILLWVRNLGDMFIYYQWIESYRPNKVIASLCGMYSGLIGVYLVWTDNRDAEKKRAKALRIEEANKKEE